MTKKGCIKQRHAKKYVEPSLVLEQKNPQNCAQSRITPISVQKQKIQLVARNIVCTYLPRYLEGLPVAATATLNGLEWNLIFLSFLVKNINCHEHRRSNIKGTS